MTPPLGALHPFWPVLVGPREDAYRETRRRLERQRVVTTAVVVAVASALFIRSDFALLDPGAIRSATVAGRLGLILLSLAVMAIVTRPYPHRLADRWVFVWVMVIVLYDLVVGAMRPADYVGNAPINPVIVLAIYVIVPLPPHLVLVGAATETVGSVLTFGVLKEMDSSSVWAVVIALGVANVLGASALWRLNRSGREHFLALSAEVEARAELERALGEVKVLRGMVPICASCKNVRDDQGFWHQVEVYVERRSEATFTHGLCPKCLEELYADLEPEAGGEVEEGA